MKTKNIDLKHVLLILVSMVILTMPVLKFAPYSQTALANGNTITYTYDDAARLTGVEYPDGVTITYTYDNAGNLLGRNVVAEWTPLAYDGDHSGKIEFNEMVLALMDYLASEITFNQMVEVLMVYLTG